MSFKAPHGKYMTKRQNYPSTVVAVSSENSQKPMFHLEVRDSLTLIIICSLHTFEEVAGMVIPGVMIGPLRFLLLDFNHFWDLSVAVLTSPT